MVANAKKSASAAPTAVSMTQHTGAKRLNNPTADAHEFVTPEIEAPKTVDYGSYPSWIRERDEALDPQLVWKGKGEQDAAGLSVTAPPIYIQERIEPHILIDELRKETARRRVASGDEPASLFDLLPEYDDGIPNELDKIDFYNHPANWTNRMILGDSLQVMSSLAEREDLRGKVQMVYIDPPYGIKFNSNWQVSARSRDVKDGKVEGVSGQVEQIKAFRDTWTLGINTYLSYLRDRLVVARDLLAETGSVFVQIGDENVHLVRSLLDEVFGVENFCSLITFKTTTGATGDLLPGTVNFILWYGKTRDRVKFRQLYFLKQLGGVGATDYGFIELPDGSREPISSYEAGALPTGARPYTLDNLMSQSVGREKGEGAASWFHVKFKGGDYTPNATSRWKTNESGMKRLELAGRLGVRGNTLRYIRYLDDFPAVAITDMWDDTSTGFGADKTYVVQTSPKIIERCMLMATDPGDLVLDPTCGSGTTAYVAEQWGRRWITIDTSRVALALARQRLMGAKYPAYLLADSEEGRRKEAEVRQRPYEKSATNGDIRKGFVYECVPHIMLSSIARNSEIVEGMTREEIDKAIKKYAGSEVLYDRPYEAKRAIRVAGTFTMESLSPHRAVGFDTDLPASEQAADQSASGGSYEDTILANLAKSGVQNGRTNERLTFDGQLEQAAGQFLTAIGTRKAAEEGTPERVAIALGPEYGTVDPRFIKNAALEALHHEENIDLLLILGFAFDPTAVEAVDDLKTEEPAQVIAERKLGRIPVLLVRMNADLAMGTALAKTENANLFMVFGEPDITIEDADPDEDGNARISVRINGLDVFVPTTGKVRSDTLDDIMMWSLDTDYSGEAFVMRHCYFSGTNGKPEGLDPYTKLKTALKADIDEDAWASLYTTVSRPFPKPASGKIAVKVINQYGDEVLKVIEV